MIVLSAMDNSRHAFLVLKTQTQYPNFLRSKIKELAEDILLKPLHQRMKDFGYSEKIINGTVIENLQINSNGLLAFDVTSEYDSEGGFDVAKAREEGTDDHFVKPNAAKALFWIVGGFIRAFSKGHWVKGITASNVLEKTVSEKTPELQARLNEETQQFIKRSMSG
jgi:hypothetical protein